MSEPRPERRVCIVGTAPTYKQVPWDDPTLEIFALNDMYLLNLPRVDRWYDLHPFEKFHYRDPNQKKIPAHTVPAGFFLRPVGHLDWLRKQTIPVYLQQAPTGWTSAKVFPRQEILQALGPYFCSTPAWMIGHALLEGVTELHIYGIHLATEWEYVKQKPNLLFLLGLAVGRGVKLVVPKGSPLVWESHQYAYDPDPDTPKVAAQRQFEKLEHERTRLTALVAQRSRWARADPNLTSRLAWVQAQLADCQLAMQHAIATRPPAGF